MVNKNVERKSEASHMDLFFSIGFLPGLSKTIFIPKYNKNSHPTHWISILFCNKKSEKRFAPKRAMAA